MGEFRKEFKHKNPKNKSVAAVGKAAGGRWKSLSESIIVYQLARTLLFCHGRGVRHHDLEPHNLQIGGWVEELHRLYSAQRNLRPDVSFWEQSHDVLYPTHSMPMATSSQSDMIDPDLLGASSHELRGKQAIWCGNGVAGKFGAEGSVRRKTDDGGVQGRSGYRCMIDMEKPATSEDDDDDVEILSPARISDYAKRNAGFADNSQCYPRENAAHVRFGGYFSSSAVQKRK
ncbi:hypothetical protein ACQJBY_063100 [Aegilops geniculata]